MTGKLVYLGERGDLAAAHKLFGNALILGFGALVADVMAIAASCNVDGAAVSRLMALIDFNAVAARNGTAMAQRDFTPTFELVMARKDIGLMLEAAGPGKPLAALPAIAARMDALIAAGHGGKGPAVLAIDAG